MCSGQVMWVLYCSRHFHVSAWLTQQATQKAVASSPIRGHCPILLPTGSAASHAQLVSYARNQPVLGRWCPANLKA